MTESTNLDKEWENYISSAYDDISSNKEEYDEYREYYENSELLSANIALDINLESPKSSDIYISTKTKIAYLNQYIDLKNVFWKIPTILYTTPLNGVIKKQIKFNSITEQELIDIQERLKKEVYFSEYIITSINNPSGRIKFKDIRKVTIGISKKDIMNYRSKQKSAFYNCFVLILRIKINTIFKEFHVKVFNTGKLEIPGIQTEEIFQTILLFILEILQPHISEKLEYKLNASETVLINSNFKCGFYINREAFHDILKYKYNIQSIYDPCSYPGIQCKFYYNPDVDIQTGSQISNENKHLYINVKEISFMIFRTGSVLIVGKCDDDVLMIIYEFLKIILHNEFKQICQKNINTQNILNDNINKNKKKKIRRKNINVDN
jgi:hypothetical protein